MGGVHNTNSRVSDESWKPARKNAGQIGSSADTQGSSIQQALSDSANTCQENGREATGTRQETRPELDANLIKLTPPIGTLTSHRLITGLSPVSRLSVRYEPKPASHRLCHHSRESCRTASRVRNIPDYHRQAFCTRIRRPPEVLACVCTLLVARDTQEEQEAESSPTGKS